jgi:hypothetical protein
MSVPIVWWSALLAVVAAVNSVAWLMVATVLWRRQDWMPSQVLRSRRLQLILSAGYVLGCAYRSVLPVFDVPRVALVDSMLSTAFVGRSVATVAELCFIAQWALLLRDCSQASGGLLGRVASRTVIPLILVAEICSWYSVLTTSNLGHVFEESLWSLATALIVAGLLADFRRWHVRWRTASIWLTAAGGVYFFYLVFVDVPMYRSRWIADELAGKPYLTLWQGYLDATAHRVITYQWAVWKREVAWMSLYFSVAVWVSLWLVHAPVPVARPALRRLRLRRPFGVPGIGVLDLRRLRF